MHTRLALAVLLVAALAGPAAGGQKKEDEGSAYTPTDAVAQTLTVAEATRVVKEGLTRFRWFGFPDPFGYTKPDTIEISRAVLTARRNKNDASLPFPFSDMEVRVVSDKKNRLELGNPGLYDFEIQLTPVLKHGVIGGGKNDAAAIKALADALHFLKLQSSVEFDPAFQKRFDQAVAIFRASPRTEVPESARRFRVQAEVLFGRGDFKGAADLYEQGLTAAPGWPQGHYNRAETLASAGRYKEAIIAMRRYLTLLPNAPDARESLDRTYQWELEVTKVPAPPAPPAAPGAKG